MSLESMKYQTCPYDQEEGVLLTDVEEMYPETDENGDLQYYCMNGQHTFSYQEDGDDDE